MAGEWKSCTLGDVIELKRGYDLPQKDRRAGSVPIVSSAGTTDFHNVAMAKAPGVVTGRYGTLGEVFYVTEDFWPLNTTLYVRDFKGNDPKFVSYFLQTIDFLAYSDKAAVPGLNRNHLHEAVVRIPTNTCEQRTIAHVLGALDDKIELNRRSNETLEAIARALFKDWFIDFGPVRAKLEGRASYLAPDLWSLFPDALDSQGKPLGWRSDSLLEHALLISGGTPSTKVDEYWNGPIAWASAKDVSQCADSILIATARSITDQGLSRSATRLVPKFSTVVVARGATTGRFCMLGRDMAMNQTCYALSSRAGNPFWLNCAFGYLVKQIVHAAHGSVFDTITTKTIDATRVVVSSDEILHRFEQQAESLFLAILANIEESFTLTTLRDTLLPKLLSGELHVRDAEKLANDAL